MLVAPFSLSVPASLDRPSFRSQPGVAAARRGAKPVRIDPRVLLLAWLVFGAVALLLLPDLRVTPRLGATLPFWFVAAPAIDLAWLMRARLFALLRSGWTSRVVRRRRHQARHAAPAQSALRARSERSSRK